MFRNPLIDALVVLIVVLLFFGPKRLPALGQGLREFKDSVVGGSGDEGEHAALPPATNTTAAALGTSEAPEVEPAQRQA